MTRRFRAWDWELGVGFWELRVRILARMKRLSVGFALCVVLVTGLFVASGFHLRETLRWTTVALAEVVSRIGRNDVADRSHRQPMGLDFQPSVRALSHR
jgi:hypothetical protein